MDRIPIDATPRALSTVILTSPCFPKILLPITVSTDRKTTKLSGKAETSQRGVWAQEGIKKEISADTPNHRTRAGKNRRVTIMNRLDRSLAHEKHPRRFLLE